jgi:hypothetical protein
MVIHKVSKPFYSLCNKFIFDVVTLPNFIDEQNKSPECKKRGSPTCIVMSFYHKVGSDSKYLTLLPTPGNRVGMVHVVLKGRAEM